MVFNVVPDCKKHYTAKKMRTFLQAQENKANVLNVEVKDYFLTDLEITGASIQTIKGQIMFDCIGVSAANQEKKLTSSDIGYH